MEAKTPSLGDLATAENYAAGHAKFVSNSWGSGSEFIGENSFDSAFNHPGVAITAAAGDSGYGTEYPAASQYVTAVGGTSLSPDSTTSRGWLETAWSGTGSGCATLEPPAGWQANTGGVCQNRAENDVAAVADPNTGVAAYDTYPASGLTSGWQVMGGTSAATPIIASVYALAGNPAPDSYPAEYPWANSFLTGIYDVTSGSNGFCETFQRNLCNAVHGYDGPTGGGSPDGIAAFQVPNWTNLVAIENPGPVDYEIGTSLNVQMIGHDSAGLPLTFGLGPDGLPYGLSISASGLISGTASQGQYSVTAQITAQDSSKALGEVVFPILGAPSMRTSFHPVAGAVTFGVAGKCLDDAGNKTTNGNKIDVLKCNGKTQQKWTYLPGGNPGGAGALTIHSKCLDATGTGNLAKAVLWTCDGRAGEQWFLAGAGRLVNPVSGRCLAGPASGANGTQVWIAGCATGKSQSWTLPASPVPSGQPGKCLDDNGNGTANGNKIQIWTCDGKAQQKWVLAANGTLRVNGKCLDVSGAGKLEGTAAVLWSCDGAASQRWLVGPEGELINANSGKCLSDPEFTATDGTALELGGCYGAAGDIWAPT